MTSNKQKNPPLDAEWGPLLHQSGRDYRCVRVSASIKQNKSGSIRLHLSFSKELVRQMGEPSRANAQRGQRKDADKLKVTFHDKGFFGLTSTQGGAKRLILPVLDGIPSELLYPATICEILEQSEKSVVIRLPIEEWTALTEDA